MTTERAAFPTFICDKCHAEVIVGDGVDEHTCIVPVPTLAQMKKRLKEMEDANARPQSSWDKYMREEGYKEYPCKSHKVEMCRICYPKPDSTVETPRPLQTSCPWSHLQTVKRAVAEVKAWPKWKRDIIFSREGRNG